MLMSEQALFEKRSYTLYDFFWRECYKAFCTRISAYSGRILLREFLGFNYLNALGQLLNSKIGDNKSLEKRIAQTGKWFTVICCGILRV